MHAGRETEVHMGNPLNTFLKVFTCLALVLPASAGSCLAADGDQNRNDQGSPDLRVIFSQIAKANIPAVVHIEVTEQKLVLATPYSNNQVLPFSDQTVPQKKFKRELKGIGTGVIITGRGDVLTNNHVIEDATNIKVLLSDGRRYQASVVGSDPKTDLAVIRIKPEGKLPVITFGDSDKVEVGEWVMAIGHPRGLDQTVTQGIISATHRQGITDPSSYQDFLQTDAAINPGNSGGPLLNLRGEVIGINSIIASESGGSEGIGFAIPSNLASSISNAIIAYGKVKRGWIGINIRDIDFELARSLNLNTPQGALVEYVIKGSPADRAGLKKGDLILKLDNKGLKDSGDLRNRVSNTPIGKTIPLTIVRNGRRSDVSVTIGDLEDSRKFLVTVIKERLGLEIRPIKQQEAEDYGIDSGVAVKWLDPKGPMAEIGFEVGDIILEVEGQPIQSMDDFTGIISILPPREEVTLLAMDHRSGQSTYVQVQTR
jgi:serine protease Do